MTPDTPEFPITLTWHKTGEVDRFDDKRDLLCNLESFDSAKDGHEATAIDARQRTVSLRVDITQGVAEFELF